MSGEGGKGMEGWVGGEEIMIGMGEGVWLEGGRKVGEEVREEYGVSGGGLYVKGMMGGK